MAYEIGTAAGHEDLLEKFNTFITTVLPLAERWEVLETELTGTSVTDKHYMWKAPGLSGLEEIYSFMYARKSIASDWYNLHLNMTTGYVPGNTLGAQPGIGSYVTIPMWNQTIPYWFIGNGQRAIIYTKIENAFHSCYFGKFFPYATPSQFPYPIIYGGMILNVVDNRYSDTSLVSWWKGNRSNFRMRFIDGSFKTPRVLYFSLLSTTASTRRNTNTNSSIAEGYYGVHPLILDDGGSNIFGELDGIYHISGYNNAVENTLIIDGVTYVVLRDNTRTGLNDYIALRLQ